MTKQLIPYAFVPGTKAKADEINANFISLATTIQSTSENIQQNLNNLSEELKAEINLKPDKTDLNDIVVTETDTCLDSYKTNGAYIFTEDVKPTGLPKDVDAEQTVFDAAGTLLVIGSEDSALKQIWFSNAPHKPIFLRDYNITDSAWEDWVPSIGKNDMTKADSTGYLYLPNGIILQWGYSGGKSITYPIAYKSFVYRSVTKIGCVTGCARSDTGVVNLALTSHYFESAGSMNGQYWITLGK